MTEVTGAPNTPQPDAQQSVVAPDGARITITRVSRGPRDLLLVPGTGSPGAHWALVTALLDGCFSCWVMDRRGKGASGDREPYSIEREYDDVAAVLASFDGAPIGVAAHSSGAIVVLGAVARGAAAAWMVLYEPPWPVDGRLAPAERIDAVEALIAAGDRDAALEVALRETMGIRAPWVEFMKSAPVWPDMLALAHTFPRELRAIAALSASVDHLATITIPALVLCGTHTTAPLRRAATAIADVLPAATLAELPEQGHGALGTAPDLVARAIRDFATQARAQD